MEVGPIFSLLNDYVEDKQHMVTLLAELRDGKRVHELEVFGPPIAEEFQVAIDHVERDWFGLTPRSPSQRRFDPLNPRPTGWWTGWHGDAEAITRETMIRALEVALGVHHNEEIKPTRAWSLQFLWTCGAPFFQGWVTWQGRRHEPERGIVTVTFTTPGNGHPLYATPFRAQDAQSPSRGYERDPSEDGRCGLWCIGEKETEVAKSPTKKLRSFPAGVMPNWVSPFVHTFGGVTVLAPAEADGGTLPSGRDWWRRETD